MRLERFADRLHRHLLEESGSLLVVFNRTFSIIGCNSGFMNILGIRINPSGNDLRDYLLPESRAALLPWPAPGSRQARLNFAHHGSASAMLECVIFGDETECLIVGEQPLLSETVVLTKMSTLNNELINMTRELHQKNTALANALSEIKSLRGILPICAGCKKIRDDKGYWEQVEVYVSQHTEAEFSHGICPECERKMYAELDSLKKER